MYQALYRKYRSQTFDEIVGQTVISTTLKQAVSSGKISHAYLFSGPRGTGKTSAAKIFAKALTRSMVSHVIIAIFVVISQMVVLKMSLRLTRRLIMGLMKFVKFVISQPTRQAVLLIKFTSSMKFTCFQQGHLMRF